MKGFSLVEILIVIGIMAIVTVVAIPNLKRFNEDQVGTNVVFNLLEAARKAQANSQSKVQCPNGKDPTEYWYLSADASSAEGFTVGAGCVDGSSRFESVTNKTPLPSGITVSQVDILDFTRGVICTGTTAKIQFLNVGNQFAVSNSCAPVPENVGAVKVYLHNATTSTDTTVVIERGGSIYKQ